MPAKKEVMVGIDMGGTRLRALVVNAENKILGMQRAPTNPRQKPDRLVADLAVLVQAAVQSAGLKLSDLRTVSIGVPGAVDPMGGVVHHAPNLGWKKVALGPKLEALLKVPVFVENDVNVGMMGEYALGAGQGAQELVGIFVGTGIGEASSAEDDSTWALAAPPERSATWSWRSTGLAVAAATAVAQKPWPAAPRWSATSAPPYGEEKRASS